MPTKRKFLTKAGDKEYLEIKWGAGEDWPSIDEAIMELENYSYLFITATIEDQFKQSYSFSSKSYPLDLINLAWEDISAKLASIVDRYNFTEIEEASFIVYQWGFTNE